MSWSRDAPFDPGHWVVDVRQRFADIDVLGHVNNVRYIDYLEQGRAGWLEAHDVKGRVRVLGHRMGFVAPMALGDFFVEVSTGVVAVEEGVVRTAQTVLTRTGPDDLEGTVHLRAESWLGLEDRAALDELRGHADPTIAHAWRETRAVDRPPRHRHTEDVRARDLGPGGIARDDTVVEWFQEARVSYLHGLRDVADDWSGIVVARTDVDLLADVGTAAGIEVDTWVSHLGASSLTLGARLLDHDGATCARATVVVVCFDSATQRSAPMPAGMRAVLEAELA